MGSPLSRLQWLSVQSLSIPPIYTVVFQQRTSFWWSHSGTVTPAHELSAGNVLVMASPIHWCSNLPWNFPLPASMSFTKTTRNVHFLLHTSSWGVPETPWAQGGSQSNTRDLWHRWWEGPNDPSVGEGPGRWEGLPPMETRSHEGEAISYA